MPRFNTTVQFPSHEDYLNVKTLASATNRNIGDMIAELAHKDATQRKIKLPYSTDMAKKA